MCQSLGKQTNHRRPLATRSRGWGNVQTSMKAGKSSSATGDIRSRRGNVQTSMKAGKSSSAIDGLRPRKAGKASSASGGKHVVRQRVASRTDGEGAVRASVYCNGVRIRCHASKVQELKVACKALRHTRPSWSEQAWLEATKVLKADMDLCVRRHGGQAPRIGVGHWQRRDRIRVAPRIGAGHWQRRDRIRFAPRIGVGHWQRRDRIRVDHGNRI